MKVLNKIQNKLKSRNRIFSKLTSFARKKRTVYFSFVGIAIIVVSTLIYNFAPFFNQLNYELSPQALELVGDVRDDAADYLKSNEQQTAYEFVVPEQGGDAGEHTGRVADAYSANFNTNPKDGISVTDTNTDITINLIPKFVSAEGKVAPGKQVVYPFGKNQLVYSLKYNGLKEDIIIPEFTDDELNHKFELVLPVGAEARLESNGDIGIYAAEGTLFGEVSYGSDADRELVEKARENSEKNNLIASIPAPIIKESNGTEHTDKSVFKLSDRTTEKTESNADVPEEIKDKVESSTTINKYTLSIESKQLKDLSYPISVDPTFQITSAADFTDLETKDGVEIDTTNNLIRRGSMTGGTVASWSAGTVLPDELLGFGTIVNNGYMYIIGGDDATVRQDVDYVKLNTNGTFAANSGCGTTWCSATSLPTEGRRFFGAAAYNGYVYVMGGNGSSTTYLDSVIYAKINKDGTLGAWTTTASITVARRILTGIAYEGYLYNFGGYAGAGGGFDQNRSEYARLNADGSIASDSGCGSSWCANPNMPTTRTGVGVAAYNGWLYLVGGTSGNSTEYSTVYYARVNGDGTLGSWITTSSMNSARYSHGVEVWNGYIYATGGCTDVSSGNCTAYTNTVEYAPINANGSLGAWQYTDSFTTISSQHGSAMWNGYLYVMGGCIAGLCTYTDRVQYTAISSAGALEDGSWSTTTTFSESARRWHNMHVYNGYLYIIGGRTWQPFFRNNVQYAQINANGTIGAWTVDTDNFSSGRRNFASEIYGGYIYISGGMTSDVSSSDIDTVEYAAINSDGSIGSWSTTTSLPTEVAWHDMFAANGYLYSVGGAFYNDVMRATINSSTGAIGSWSSAGAMPFQTSDITVLLHNGYVYLVGGCSGTNGACPGGGGSSSDYVTTVRYATVNSNGTIGGWTTTSSYTSGRYANDAFIYNGYLYMSGGLDNTTATAFDDVQLAPINSDGSLGSFSYTEDLPDTYVSHTTVAHNGYMYVAGGETSGGTTAIVSYQEINNGGQGSPTTFSAGLSLGFGQNRKQHASVAYNGYLYVLGGCTGTSPCSSVTPTIRYSAISPTGSMGAFADTTTSLSGNRYNHYAFVLNGRMYVAGGVNSSGTVLTSIHYIDIQSNGNINTSWTTDDTALPTTGLGPGMALNDNVLYMLGGASSETTTRYAVINTSTGDVGSFSTSTALPQGRYMMWTVIYKDYIYAIGGNSAAGRLRTVYYAQLNVDNTIGTWKATSQIGNALNSPSLTASFALNGYMYIVGGESASGQYNRTQFAAILPAGGLGDWQTGPASGLTAHGNMAATQYNGYLYQTGGQVTGTDPTPLTRYAAIQSIPRIGSFSKFYDFEAGVRPEKLITRGLKQTGSTLAGSGGYNVSCDNSAWASAGVIPDMGLGSADMLTLSLPGGTTLARCIGFSYQLDDTYSAIFPDTGNQSYITDFDMYYISNPGTRLRGSINFSRSFAGA